MKSRGAALALMSILVLAAVLRFAGLGWGLRHEPDWDERVFVQSAAWMVAARDLDHRFYEYPGLVVYLLAPAVAPHHPPEVGPEAYLAARRVVAGFGVAAVLLTFLLGRRLGGTALGLSAALLLAVSPLDVQTAHMVRPDVVLAAFFLIGLLVFDTIAERDPRNIASGLAIGAATAVKFTGVLLAPSYLLRRWTTGGDPVRGPGLAATASLVAFAALSPFSLLHWRGFAEGMATQWSYHYGSRETVRTFADKLFHDLHRLEASFGLAAAVLILLGFVVAASEDRRWWPVILLPAVVLLTVATADVQWPRFLVPITGVLALGLGVVVAGIAQRMGPTAAVILTLAAAASPAIESARYVYRVAQPGARDRALDWMEANVRPGARVLTTVGLGLDRARYEVLATTRLDETSQRWARHMDAVIVGPLDDTAAWSGFEVAHTEADRGIPLDVPVRVLVPSAAARPAYQPVPLAASALAASENAADVGALVDGDLETAWRSEGPQTPEDSWIEVHLPGRVTVGRVVLGLGRHWRREPRNLHVFVRDGDAPWQRVRAWPGRSPVEQQPGPPDERGLEYILEPTPASAVRLVQVGRAGKHWNAAELRIDAVP
jgi:hypothetical protein